MPYAICNEIFQDHPPEEQFRLAAECGYDGIEIAPFTIADDVRHISAQERSRIVVLGERHGLDIVGLHWLLVSPKGLHLTTPDDDVRRRTVAYMCDLVRLCHDLGGQIMVFGSPSQRNIVEGQTREATIARLKEGFIECMSIPEAEGITLCLEPLTGEQANIINTAAEAREIVDEIDHPRVRMILDCRSMADEEDDLGEAIRASKGYMRHLHVNDDNGLGPGFGGTDFAPVAQAVKDIGFDGYLSVEVFDFSLNSVDVAKKSIAFLRETFE
ncbi:MAG: sugar phosphate isomerase/epimerase family protein [Armatimonadota bacterium]